MHQQQQQIKQQYKSSPQQLQQFQQEQRGEEFSNNLSYLNFANNESVPSIQRPVSHKISNNKKVIYFIKLNTKLN